MEKTVKAYAKINLSLDVQDKLPDGYHNISTVMQSITLADLLSISVSPSESDSISLVCENCNDYPDISWDEHNLIHKAASLMLSQTDKKYSINISIRKNIPSGAGLGGGSADAAATLNALNEMLSIGLSADAVSALGAKLGADIPFCVVNGTRLCSGIGDIISTVPDAPALSVVILKPDVSISTREMYEHIDNICMPEDHVSVFKTVTALSMASSDMLFNSLGNIFELPAFYLYPEVKALKDQLLQAGAGAALMSGSGSAVYGLFETEESAKKAFESLKDSKAKCYLASFINP